MKKLLSTTALVIAMTSGAVYADTAATGFNQVEMQQGDFYASDLIGMRIYNSETAVDADTAIADGGEDDWNDLGEINDIIVTQDGSVSAVILGVGGFLGIGERDVAVPMDAITIVREEGDSDDRFLVVSTTKEALEQMPPFERDDREDALNEETAAPAADVDADAEQMDDAAVDADAEQMNETAAERQMLTRPAIEREGYAEVDMEAVHQMTSEDLTGANVYGANDETVGEINSLVVGDDGAISKVVIGVGGFLGIGEKEVAVTFDELQILQEADGDDVRIYIDSTKEALEAQPEFEN